MKYLLKCIAAALTLATVATAATANSSLNTIQYSPDGKLLLVRVSYGYRVMNAKDAGLRSNWVARGRSHIETFSADSKSILLAYSPLKGPEGSATLVEMGTSGGVRFTYGPMAGFGLPSTLAVSQSSDLFLTAEYQGSAHIWKRGVSAPQQSFNEEGIVDALFGPGDDRVTIIQDMLVTVRNLSNWRVTSTRNAYEYDYFEEGIYTRNQRSLLLKTWASYDNRQIIYSVDANSLEGNFGYLKHIGYISVGLNTLATCNGANNKIFIRRFSMDIKDILKLPYKCGGLAMSPDSTQVVTIDHDRTRVDAWNAKTGKLVWSFTRL
jgi:WD40 repeat protein